MWLRRIIRTILEITIAIAIFIIIAQKTSLLTKIMNMLAYSDIQTAIAFDSQTPTVNNTLQPNIPFTRMQNPTITTKNTPRTPWPETPLSTTITPYLTTSSKDSYNYMPLINTTSCSYQWQSISEGTSITAYTSPLSDNHNMCYAEARTCRNGKLSGSYRYSTCSYQSDGKRNGIDMVAGASDASHQTVLWLRNWLQWISKASREYTQPLPARDYTPLTSTDTHAHGMENTRFDSYRPATIDTLDQSITKSTSSYHASCMTPRGESINHGSFTFAYDISTSDIHRQCIVEKRSCLDGKLSGTFTHQSCDFWLQNNSAPQSSQDGPDTISSQTNINAWQSNRDRVMALYEYFF